MYTIHAIPGNESSEHDRSSISMGSGMGTIMASVQVSARCKPLHIPSQTLPLPASAASPCLYPATGPICLLLGQASPILQPRTQPQHSTLLIPMQMLHGYSVFSKLAGVERPSCSVLSVCRVLQFVGCMCMPRMRVAWPSFSSVLQPFFRYIPVQQAGACSQQRIVK
jgi:hypothetical protein